MSLALLLDAGLCLMVLAAALSAISGRDLFGSIAFYIIYGILIALAWMRLDAVDVALAEAAIGAGLTGVLLISAWSMLKQRGVQEEPRRPSAPRRPLHGTLMPASFPPRLKSSNAAARLPGCIAICREMLRLSSFSY
jgi:uncharacterized MnhB-related membrane protein